MIHIGRRDVAEFLTTFGREFKMNFHAAQIPVGELGAADDVTREIIRGAAAGRAFLDNDGFHLRLAAGLLLDVLQDFVAGRHWAEQRTSLFIHDVAAAVMHHAEFEEGRFLDLNLRRFLVGRRKTGHLN